MIKPNDQHLFVSYDLKNSVLSIAKLRLWRFSQYLIFNQLWKYLYSFFSICKKLVLSSE